MYHYKIRPGYGTKELLVEFAPKKADSDFFDALFEVLNEMKVRVQDIEDLWMNDEVLMNCQSELGKFVISKDVWDLVFIMDFENNEAIEEVDSRLKGSRKFIEDAVDFTEYETEKGDFNKSC